VRNVHPNALLGALSSVVVDFGVPIISTKSSWETSRLIVSLAKRENGLPKNFSLHSNKEMSLERSQEYVVSAFPFVGPVVAGELIKHFGSLKKIVNASLEDLKSVSGVGDKIAKSIRDVCDFSKE